MARGSIVALCSCVLAGAAVFAPGGSAGAEPSPTTVRAPAPPSVRLAHALPRVISVRVRHTRLSVARNTNARRIGRSIAALRPTWVTGTLRFARNQYPKRDELRAWREIRRIVQARNPNAQFDVVLNAEQYRTKAAIRLTMRRMRTKLGPEGWFFDFFSNAFKKKPKMIRAAIRSAHAHGEFVGGNVFGIAKRRKLPAKADFYSVQDSGFHLNLPAVRRLTRRKPILYHLNSEPAHQRSGGCRFIERLSTKRRLAHVRRRAAQGARHGFRVSYPVMFPQCLRARPQGPGSFLYAYNAFRDPPMAREIGRLLDRYEFAH